MNNNGRWVTVLVALVLCCVVAGFILWQQQQEQEGTMAVISVAGQAVQQVDLSQVVEPYEINVQGKLGENKIAVASRQISMSHAPCPDQICIKQGWIHNGVFPIVCLPNEITITIINNTAIDGVSK